VCLIPEVSSAIVAAAAVADAVDAADAAVATPLGGR